VVKKEKRDAIWHCAKRTRANFFWHKTVWHKNVPILVVPIFFGTKFFGTTKVSEWHNPSCLH
jgi:hypothetical protein